MLTRAIAVFLFLIVAVVAFGQTATPVKLKPGDRIRVVVIGFEQFDAEYDVLTDGSVTGIGFERTMAAGRTIEQFRKVITPQIGRYIRDPQVAVVMLTERLQSVFFVRIDPVGENILSASEIVTNTQGAIPWEPGLTLQKLLAQVRLPNQMEFYETRIHRRDGTTRQVDVDEVLKNNRSAWNGPLLPDDIVTMMPKPLLRLWVVGNVKRPGRYAVPANLDLAAVLARALGIEEQARVTGYPMRVVVRRGPDVFEFSENNLPGRAEFAVDSGDTISVELPKLIRIVVGGEVKDPGEYFVPASTMLSEAVLGRGGGLSQTGTARGVIILRKNEVFVSDADAPKPGETGFALQDGDSIFVLRNVQEIFVLGRVRNPGRFAYPTEKPLYLTDALALAGGLDQRGTLRRVHVLTREGDRMVAKQYNLDEFLKDGKEASNPKLKPGDSVLFGEPQGVTLQTLTQLLTTTLLLDNLISR